MYHASARAREMIAEVIRENSSGKVFNFDPASLIPESEKMRSYHVAPPLQGMTLAAAVRKAEKRLNDNAIIGGYHKVVPCVGCQNCVVIQEIELGRLVNASYHCHLRKTDVDRFGTCDSALEGDRKRGPLVIKRNKTVEEIEAHKERYMN